jgi:hypothetical protein
MTTLKELEKRIEALEDLEAIKKMKAQYGQLCDDRYGKGDDEIEAHSRKIAELFTEDGIWDGGQVFGIHKGRKEIYEYFARPAINFALHFFAKPDLTVEGNLAKGRWYLWMPGTTNKNIPFWLAGYEDDEYNKVDGKWLHNYMKFEVHFLTPYDEGWVKKRFIE